MDPENTEEIISHCDVEALQDPQEELEVVRRQRGVGTALLVSTVIITCKAKWRYYYFLDRPVLCFSFRAERIDFLS